MKPSADESRDSTRKSSEETSLQTRPQEIWDRRNRGKTAGVELNRQPHFDAGSRSSFFLVLDVLHVAAEEAMTAASPLADTTVSSKASTARFVVRGRSGAIALIAGVSLANSVVKVFKF